MWGQGAGSSLTPPNTDFMFVTREVSQLSGWLKSRACCRGSQAGHTVRGGLRAGRREAAGGERGVHAACRGEGTTADWGVWRGEQRTINMSFMLVTREVSQLSGWLKSHACCRGSQAGHTVRGGLRARRREAAGDRGVHAACRGEGCDCRYWGGGARRGAHLKHCSHVRDAGGVPAQRLVEGYRALCRGSHKQGTWCGASCGPGGGRRRASAVCMQCAGETECATAD